MSLFTSMFAGVNLKNIVTKLVNHSTHSADVYIYIPVILFSHSDLVDLELKSSMLCPSFSD